MKGAMRVHYDEDGDFLEISIGEATPCYAEEVEPGVFIRFDEESNEIKSIGILGFKERSKDLKDIILNLPIDVNFSIPINS